MGPIRDPKQIPVSSPSEAVVWLKNPHGIKQALPKSVADWRLKTSPGYKLCEPDFVPEEKQYPDDVQLNEAGAKRRKNIRNRAGKPDKETPKEEKTLDVEYSIPQLEEMVNDGQTLTKKQYREINWPSLKKYGTTRGVDVLGKKRVEILSELDKSHL